MTGEDGKTVGYTPFGVRDPEGRGVALLVHLRIEGAADKAHTIASRMFPKKIRNGSAMIIKTDNSGSTAEIDVLIGAAVQQTGVDACRAAAKAAGIPMSKVTYSTSGGVMCGVTADMPGSPRAGQGWTSRQGRISPHR